MGCVQSKYLSVLPYTCHEVGHTWDPSCTRSTVEVGWTSLYESAKIYASVYAFSVLMHGRRPKVEELLVLISNIAQSTLFLFYNTFGFVAAFCTVRKVLDGLNFYTVGFVPAWICSYLAVQVERPSRRPLLAVYCGNVATESLIEAGKKWGLWPRLKHGEVFSFAVVSAVLTVVYKGLEFPDAKISGQSLPSNSSKEAKKSIKNDFTFTILRTILGNSESKLMRSEASNEGRDSMQHQTKLANINVSRDGMKMVTYGLKMLQSYWTKAVPGVVNIVNGGASGCCPHVNESCRSHISKGVIGPFLIGSFIKLALAVLKRFRRQNHTTILQWSTFDLGIFLGLYGGTYKLSSCFHRHIFGQDSKSISGLSGFLAGLASWVYPSKTIAVYSAWKAAEILTYLGVSTGHLPKIPQFVELVYATATAVLFHLSITDPNSLKPTYLSFMNKITGNRVNEINRFLIDHEYGTNASALFSTPPSYDTKNHSERFRQAWIVILDKVKKR